jgi:hypothetical protein
MMQTKQGVGIISETGWFPLSRFGVFLAVAIGMVIGWALYF